MSKQTQVPSKIITTSSGHYPLPPDIQPPWLLLGYCRWHIPTFRRVFAHVLLDAWKIVLQLQPHSLLHLQSPQSTYSYPFCRSNSNNLSVGKLSLNLYFQLPDKIMRCYIYPHSPHSSLRKRVTIANMKCFFYARLLLYVPTKLSQQPCGGK